MKNFSTPTEATKLAKSFVHGTRYIHIAPRRGENRRIRGSTSIQKKISYACNHVTRNIRTQKSGYRFLTEEFAFYAQPEYWKIPAAEAVIERCRKGGRSRRIKCDSPWTSGMGQRAHTVQAPANRVDRFYFSTVAEVVRLLRSFDRRYLAVTTRRPSWSSAIFEPSSFQIVNFSRNNRKVGTTRPGFYPAWCQFYCSLVASNETSVTWYIFFAM